MHSSEIEKGTGIFKFVKESGSVLRRGTVQALTQTKDGFRVTLLLGTGTGTSEYALVDELSRTAARLLAMGVPVIAKVAHFEPKASTVPTTGNPIKQVVVALMSAKKFLERDKALTTSTEGLEPTASRPKKKKEPVAVTPVELPSAPPAPESQVA